MRQVLRLMGMPDKVIAFDELPADLLDGLEMLDETKMPRHWREYIGVREKLTKIAPYIDPMTRQLVQCEPVLQEGAFTWAIDWEINSNKERWQEIASYVRRNAPRDFRLLDKIEDMAKPLANSVSSEITLEPEEVIVIPLPKVASEEESKAAPVRVVSGEEMAKLEPKVQGSTMPPTPEIVAEKPVSAPNPESVTPPIPKSLDCEVCGHKFADGRGRFKHMQKHQPKKQPIAA